MDIEKLRERIYSLDIPDSLKNKLFEKLSKEEGLTEEMIEEIIDEVVKSYKNALIEPYEAVGIVAAQSIGEPGTQMSLPYDEKIIVKEGENVRIVEIGKFVDECIDKFGFIKQGVHEICDLPVEIYALSLDQDEKVHWKRIISVIRHKFNGKLIKIKTRSGRTIVATPYHSFVVRKDNRVVPIEGRELKIGDRIPAIRYMPLNCISEIDLGEFTNYSTNRTLKLDFDFGYFLGLYLADGYSTKYFISIPNKNREVVKIVKRLAEKLGIRLEVGYEIKLYSPVLSELIQNFDKKEKRIPDFVFSSEKEFVRGLLQGYFDGNGKVDVEKKKIKIYSQFKELIDGISLLLTRFGIFCVKRENGIEISHIYAKKFAEEINSSLPKRAEELNKLVKSLESKVTYDPIDMIPSIGTILLDISKKLGYPSCKVEKFIKNQKIGRLTLQRHLLNLEKLAKERGFEVEELKVLKKAVESDVVWDEIVSIEEVDCNNYVYDLSVEGLETFTTAEGLITHNTMRTFHYAGVAELNVTLGLPRMIEIVDARKEPSTPIMEVYLTDEYKYDKEKAEEVAKRIESLTLQDVAKSIGIDLWTQSIKVELDEKVIEDRGLDIEEIEEAIRKKVRVKIEREGNILYLKVKTPSVKSLRKRIPKIKNILLKGIPGITRVLVKKDDKTGEYVIHTQGSNLREVFKIEGVDTRRTITNNIIEIQEVLGIEAARNAIINEMKNTLEQQGLEVDIRHLMLVADMMTADGEVKPIGRHGVAGEKGSVLARAAFEETVKHLYSASEKGEVDKLKGVIENVIVGKPIFLGTGCVRLEIDREYEEGKKE
ncbi:RNA polymerase Rpb1 domain 5 [Methanocaldococcus infernus ME]|uniref:DNA-directed RNA polymerase subunit Rpo1C n=1 Tax=Methanocaldococcus infernus (strain DSM 11812 / JCM 15783 / ME) TaxID=573063 RepID=D5VRW2_METIM|nr:DNA-directed RNA polymerase subunit A'' [Methanocaldococcus infernus]ADG13315.1 RNA polymerase Rpb1 domain 5 [Methanocaldococcus infernus ME]